MFCVGKSKGQKIEDNRAATDVKVIGLMVQSDFDYIRNSDIVNLDLSEADITEIGNDRNYYDNKYVNSFCASKLKGVILPKKLKIIKKWAFDSCAFLASINMSNSVTAIGKCAFEDCKSLSSISIPNSVTVIGERAFKNCTSLTSINIPSSVATIGLSAFSNCPLLTLSVEEKGNFIVRDNVLYTEDGAQLVCTAGSPQYINIPSSVVAIDNYTFRDCVSLISINIPISVTAIGLSAFNGCTSLAFINIPSSVTVIAFNAFSNCVSLASVNIPSSVTTIDRWAFYGCESLSSIVIPSSVNVIGEYAFSSCRLLTSIDILGSTTRIDYRAFSGCKSLTSVKIESNSTNICENIFENCVSLSSVRILSNVCRIARCAFYKCYSLAFVQLLSQSMGVSIDKTGFSDCPVRLMNINDRCIDMDVDIDAAAFGSSSYIMNGTRVFNISGSWKSTSKGGKISFRHLLEHSFRF